LSEVFYSFHTRSNISLKNKVNIFWFRRDLRLNDNAGFYHALESRLPVLPIFIFDTKILKDLKKDDPRVTFIWENLKKINEELKKHDSRLIIKYGNPVDVWENLITEYLPEKVYANHDYEPYALERDLQVSQFLAKHKIDFISFKDQVIFERAEVVKNDGKPYTVYTPYMNKWLVRLHENSIPAFPTQNYFNNFLKLSWSEIPGLENFGFAKSKIIVPYAMYDTVRIENYEQTRNFPFVDGTTMVGPHLRLGTISIRELVTRADEAENKSFLKELIWREFFMQILFHFPYVIKKSFKPAYDRIHWKNNEDDYRRWCEGTTGYPMVDAGMRELNATGFMHNRVRMVVASFLCKHLLIDWRWGEAYFAKKLLDFELSSNNGNWQWAAGSGCDAAPYFRIFNPTEQLKKFDPDLKYISKWIPELNTRDYPTPMIEHRFARERAIEVYKRSLAG
jgi:deoxyribodipyrimidine photo-lyase